MWWQDKSPSLSSSRPSSIPNEQVGACNQTQSTLAYLISDKMIVPSNEEFRKLSSERQTEELFILIQRLLPLTKRIDSLSDSVGSLTDRMTSIETHQASKLPGGQNLDNEADFTAQDSDSLYKSLTSLAPESSINKPDPFIIKRSKEINK